MRVKLLVSAGLICLSLLNAPIAFAGRPLVVDDARPVAEGNFQFTFGFVQSLPEKGGRDQQIPVITSSYGVYKNLEAGLTIQRTNTDLKGERPVRGFQDLHLFTKYNFVEEIEKGYVPALTFLFDLEIPTANSHRGLTTGKFNQGMLLIATKHFFPAAFDLNLGYTVVGRRAGEHLENQFFGGVALRYGLNETWRLVGDVYGLTRPARGEPPDANFQLGVRFRPDLPAYFDLAVGRSLLSTGNRFQVTFGITWSRALNF